MAHPGLLFSPLSTIYVFGLPICDKSAVKLVRVLQLSSTYDFPLFPKNFSLFSVGSGAGGAICDNFAEMVSISTPL